MNLLYKLCSWFPRKYGYTTLYDLHKRFPFLYTYTLRMLDHHTQISFKYRCEIIPQTPAWAYKYEWIWKI